MSRIVIVISFHSYSCLLKNTYHWGGGGGRLVLLSYGSRKIACSSGDGTFYVQKNVPRVSIITCITTVWKQQHKRAVCTQFMSCYRDRKIYLIRS
jgi:hypothetical protein